MSQSSSYVAAPASTPSQLHAAIGKLAASLPELPQVEWTAKTIATSVLAVVVTLLVAEQALWRSRKQQLPGHAWQIVRSPSFPPPQLRNPRADCMDTFTSPSSASLPSR